MHVLIEHARAHLLVVETPVEYRRERHVHVVAGGCSVLQHLVLVNVSAHHVVDAELVRQVPVRETEEPVLIAFAHVVWQRHHNVSHNHRVLRVARFPAALWASFTRSMRRCTVPQFGSPSRGTTRPTTS